MLAWAPEAAAGGAARMEMELHAAVHAFASRCFTSPAIPDKAEAARRSVMRLRHVEAFWIRVVGELASSGLAEALVDANASDADDYFDVFMQLQLQDPTRMAITAGDWDTCDEFDIAGQPARGQRGRAGYRAAVAADPGPTALRFLELATIPHLEVPADPAPWKVIARLAGALGFCLTRAARLDEMSAIRIAAAPLEAAMRERYRGATDGLLARNLKGFMLSCSLPGVLAAKSVDGHELNVQLLDSISYQEGGSKALSVLASRMYLLEHR